MISNLVKQVNTVISKYEELEKAKSENFNLFNIMNMRTDEVKTHSAIIAELLNPKGTHNLDDTFLKLFLVKINLNFNNELNLKDLIKTKTFVEYNIGQISENLTEGGRIDILISNKNFSICIENKINAGDQPYQLKRYHNYLSKKKNKTLLIYLTPNGKEPNNDSICSSQLINEVWEKDYSHFLCNEKDYFCISYRSFILEWLEECYIYTIDQPILRESLKQYIILIKSLTNQSKSIQMEKEIQEAILRDLKSADTIHNSFFDALNNVILSFCEHLKKSLTDIGFEKEKIEIRNWKDENRFFTLFLNNNEPNPRIGFEIYNGSLSFGETYTMIDIENENWGKQPSEKWGKNETYEMISDYYNGSYEKKEFIINQIRDYIIEKTTIANNG